MIKLLKNGWGELTKPQKNSLILLVGLGTGVAVGVFRMMPDLQAAKDRAAFYQGRLSERAATIRDLESDRDRIKTTLCAELRGRHAECKDPFPTSLSLLKLLTTCAATGACPHAGRLKGNE